MDSRLNHLASVCDAGEYEAIAGADKFGDAFVLRLPTDVSSQVGLPPCQGVMVAAMTVEYWAWVVQSFRPEASGQSMGPVQELLVSDTPSSQLPHCQHCHHHDLQQAIKPAQS